MLDHFIQHYLEQSAEELKIFCDSFTQTIISLCSDHSLYDSRLKMFKRCCKSSKIYEYSDKRLKFILFCTLLCTSLNVLPYKHQGH